MTGSEYFEVISDFVQAGNGIFYSTGYAREASLTICNKRQKKSSNKLLTGDSGIHRITKLISYLICPSFLICFLLCSIITWISNF